MLVKIFYWFIPAPLAAAPANSLVGVPFGAGLRTGAGQSHAGYATMSTGQTLKRSSPTDWKGENPACCDRQV